MENMDLNYIGLLISVIAAMGFNFFWYSPRLFGEAWSKAVKVTTKDMMEPKKGISLAALITLIQAIGLNMVLNAYVALSVVEGFVIGILVGALFVATTQASAVLWEAKPLKVLYINGGAAVITFALMGTILML